jgi:large subunit ribosomal protein L29
MAQRKDLRQLSAAELQQQVLERRRELYDLRCDRATRKAMEKTHLIRLKRRDIARMLTLLTEMAMGRVVQVKAPKVRAKSAKVEAEPEAEVTRPARKKVTRAKAPEPAEVKAAAEAVDKPAAKPRKRATKVKDE